MVSIRHDDVDSNVSVGGDDDGGIIFMVKVLTNIR